MTTNLKVKGNSGGSGVFTLTTPSSANTQTLTVPDGTTTLVGTDTVQTLTNKTLTSPTIGGTPTMDASVITSGTAQASTSGTYIDFTGIPSWVKRITVMFSGVSTNGTSDVAIQIGTSGGIENSGYLGTQTRLAATSLTTSVLAGDSFAFNDNSGASTVRHGISTFALIGSNIWTFQGTVAKSDTTAQMVTTGSKTLSGTLDRIRITTVGGVNTFDAGTINILYE